MTATHSKHVPKEEIDSFLASISAPPPGCLNAFGGDDDSFDLEVDCGWVPRRDLDANYEEEAKLVEAVDIDFCAEEEATVCPSAPRRITTKDARARKAAAKEESDAWIAEATAKIAKAAAKKKIAAAAAVAKAKDDDAAKKTIRGATRTVRSARAHVARMNRARQQAKRCSF